MPAGGAWNMLMWLLVVLWPYLIQKALLLGSTAVTNLPVGFLWFPVWLVPHSRGVLKSKNGDGWLGTTWRKQAADCRCFFIIALQNAPVTSVMELRSALYTVLQQPSWEKCQDVYCLMGKAGLSLCSQRTCSPCLSGGGGHGFAQLGGCSYVSMHPPNWEMKWEGDCQAQVL